ncbi:RNA pyrophosphohydrolase [Aureimonas phyllosphaerae]|uniref:RNA pyrophosphohydrolase n=1 Tax=Aureimonas phyllosphaerae TaxID=1166078 RepID=A0A7W6FSW1_9HYPH|nr:RNA pyrophosphohydrolase [Aureimonas phyllosphaerae]MBB3934080.1 putative (di)nucleoside polyphosphate hydrolase [Aureimonas phyllosphaerae]MBB3958704.1 putative (di)nucleoside polyphosphate hydrolase [Aureimonas phyllosphaerae]SFF18210.1 putative (di)nucleoside polyphosphate hydrolase [Aureimonas phyllosphaerae]
MPPSPDSLPYRPCVGIMVLNDDGKVFVGRRIAEPQGEMDGASQLWQMPQGGIDEGEDPLEAAKRELYEETGIRSVSLLGTTDGWVRYELPPHLLGVALKGRFRGQMQKWFAFRFEGDESEIQIDPPPGDHDAEFSEWAWKSLDEVLDLVVPFKRGVYEEVVRAFRHLEGGR